MEQLKLMLEEAGKDEDFAKVIFSLIEKGDVPAIISAAAQKGFKITEADWQEYTKWSESVSSKVKSNEVLSEEQLEDIAGGNGDGSFRDAYKRECWFYPKGETEFRDGVSRRRCGAATCINLYYNKGEYIWIECKCRFTPKCVNCWHDTNECPR